MSIERDTPLVAEVLEIPAHAPYFAGLIDLDPRQFLHLKCEECGEQAEVYVEFTVDEPGEGWSPCDARLCAEHAGPGVRVILDREDRSHDHNMDVTVNHWAIVHGAFNANDDAKAAA